MRGVVFLGGREHEIQDCPDPARRRRWTGLAFSPTSQERWMLWLRVENEHLAAIAEGKPLVEALSDRFYKCRLLGE